MFCPKCGIEDQSANQFCRSCGAALHAVRSALEQPDAITTSAVTAREEIGRAIAAKIAKFEDSDDLRRAVYEILPAIEGFLESPEERRAHQQEKRLNRIREGVITSTVGLAVIVFFMLISWLTHEEKVLIGSGAGLLVLMIGIGIIVAASWFTAVPKRLGASYPKVFDEKQNSLLNKELPPAKHSTFPSVTEGTTREL
ncbi:MAG TPA: hypothetical protein VKF81_09875 [Blastocatellia bacterium]|nr:hypothetical protein [Blastocatellia bacterium]